MNIEQLAKGTNLVANIDKTKKTISTLQLLIATINTKQVHLVRNEHIITLDVSIAKVALILQLEGEKETLQHLEQELVEL